MKKKSKRKTAKILDIELPLASESKLADIGFTLCMLFTIPPNHPENIKAECFKCGDLLQYHPSTPKSVKKICPTCFKILQLKHDDLELYTTKSQVKAIERMTKGKTTR